MSEINDEKTVEPQDVLPVPEPLVRYRKTDDFRRKQMDSLQDEVADKVLEVMESFKVSPSKTEQLEKKLLNKRSTRKHVVVIKKHSPWWWLFASLICAGLGLLVFGWMKLPA